MCSVIFALLGYTLKVDFVVDHNMNIKQELIFINTNMGYILCCCCYL